MDTDNFTLNLRYKKRSKTMYIIQGGPKVGVQLLKVAFRSKTRFVVLI